MAAASYDADVALHDADYLVLGEGRDSIAGRARSLEDWIKLVRALLPKRSSVLDLSLRFKVPLRTLDRWKALANNNGVVVDDLSAVRAFVLQQKGMRLDKPIKKLSTQSH